MLDIFCGGLYSQVKGVFTASARVGGNCFCDCLPLSPQASGHYSQ